MPFDGTAIGVCSEGHETHLPNDWPGGRTECPQCGEVIIHVNWDLPPLEVKVALYARIQAIDPSKRSRERIRVEIVTGKEPSRTTESGWVDKERKIDKTASPASYDEIVIDPDTGEIIHEIHEPLKAHRGHGSAKFKTQQR